MRVAHVIPPQWEGALGVGQSYRMTYVPWVLEHAAYSLNLRRCHNSYVILDHGLFEHDLSIPDPNAIVRAALFVGPDEVVLPDVLGDPIETVSRAFEALHYFPFHSDLMFVPQGDTMQVWEHCLNCYLTLGFRRPTVGLSSLRRPGSLRAQVGTRIPMMKYLQPLGFEMHLLGLCSVRHFVEEELPVALELGVRGVDTCAAFALGARGLELTKDSPRLFLGDLKKYEYLAEDTLLLIKRNMDTLENWILGG